MRRSAVRRPTVIPSVTSNKTETKDLEFIKGLNSNTTNDDVEPDQWRYITDAREYNVGKWSTRRGNDFLSVPIGEATNAQNASTTGASDFSFSPQIWFAQPLVATASGRLTALEVNIKNDSSATGTIVLALFSNNAGTPGKEIFRTTIASSQVTTTYGYLRARSITCPDIVSGTTYWVVGFVQTGGNNVYKISTTTTSPGYSSPSTGMSWQSQTYGFNVRLITSTSGATQGMYRLRRPDGSSYTFLAFAGSLYQVNETTGATTVVDNGLDPAAGYVRFDYVADVLRYVQGTTKPRKYDFTIASSVATAPENASAIISHKGLEFFASAVDPNKFFFTNFGIYDTFTSTDFIYAPSPKTSDPIVGFSKLNGALYIHTRNNKYVLSGSTNSTFQLDNAIGQKGTFTQESIASDENYIFSASDEGIYKFNGAEEINLTVGTAGSGVLDWWIGLVNKRNTVLELHNNRLYVFYTGNGDATNTHCKIYNIAYDIWESDDSLGFVNNAYSNSTEGVNYFLQSSNRVGMVMYAEQATNDYNSMGEPLSYELRTSYQHFNSPAHYKRANHYRPHFDAQLNNYAVQVGYALDYADTAQYFDIWLQSIGPRFDTGLRYDTGVKFGGVTQINTTDNSPVIPGVWRRLQLRYKHYAAREPVSFDGHVISIETQRIV